MTVLELRRNSEGEFSCVRACVVAKNGQACTNPEPVALQGHLKACSAFQDYRPVAGGEMWVREAQFKSKSVIQPC